MISEDNIDRLPELIEAVENLFDRVFWQMINQVTGNQHGVKIQRPGAFGDTFHGQGVVEHAEMRV